MEEHRDCSNESETERNFDDGKVMMLHLIHHFYGVFIHVGRYTEKLKRQKMRKSSNGPEVRCIFVLPHMSRRVGCHIF
jgi:hypothetical protein